MRHVLIMRQLDSTAKRVRPERSRAHRAAGTGDETRALACAHFSTMLCCTTLTPRETPQQPFRHNGQQNMPKQLLMLVSTFLLFAEQLLALNTFQLK